MIKAVTKKEKVIKIPGIIPAINKSPIETSAATTHNIIALLAGTMIPSAADTAWLAAAYSTLYPLATIAGIRIEPIAAVVADPEPEMAAKNMEVTMATIANPPVK